MFRLLMLFAVLSTLAATPARAEGNGTIAGIVTDSVGVPVEGICVTAYRYYYDPEWGDEWWEWINEDETDSLGAYSIELAEDTYRIGFYDCNSTAPDYASEVFDNKSDIYDGDDLIVVGGASTTADAALDQAGSISGSITNESGESISGIGVALYSEDGDWVTDTYVYDGTYVIEGIRAGTYKVSFDDWRGNYESEWYNDKPSFDSADPVEIVGGLDTSGIDAALAIRLRPDMAVTDIAIENLPLRTDSGELPGTGTARRVTVSARNAGAEAAYEGEIVVWAETDTDHRPSLIGRYYIESVAVGQEIEQTFKWNGFGTLGDVTVHVESCSYDDGNGANNHKSVPYYVVVGGSGFGLTALPSNSPYCFYDW